MGDEFIAPRSSACYPGVIMDNCFFMKKHVKKICNGANYHVRNILKNKQTFPQLHLQLLPPKYLTLCTINTGGSQRRFALKNIEKAFYQAIHSTLRSLQRCILSGAMKFVPQLFWGNLSLLELLTRGSISYFSTISDAIVLITFSITF